MNYKDMFDLITEAINKKTDKVLTKTQEEYIEGLKFGYEIQVDK